jgi:aspartate/methionine/tyrosine aminotransferase
MTVLSSKLIHPRELSRRADAMPRSAIREIMALAASRPDVVHLEVGEPDFATPEHIITAAFTAVRAGATKYTGNAGRMELREQIAARMHARNRRAGACHRHRRRHRGALHRTDVDPRCRR